MQSNIAQVIGRSESEQLEYKAVLPPARSLAQMIAAFANAKGGLIVLGVAEANGEIIINGLSEDFQANSVTHRAIDLLSPKPTIDYDYINYQGKRLYVIDVAVSKVPSLFEGKTFVRKGIRMIHIDTNPKVSQTAKPAFILDLIKKLKDLKIQSTGSKDKFLDHYLGILNITADLRHQLYPVSPEELTANQEGKILMRILFSSCADNFESYLTDLLYEIYLANPDTLKSSQQVTIKEVLDCADMQEFVLFWAKKKLSKLQRGSVKGFISDNPQIKNLDILDQAEQDAIENIFQIRHLYSHRNGVVDEKFLQFYPGDFNINDVHQLSTIGMINYLSYLAEVVDKLDRAAIQRYQLATL
jgi:hypothetical protein